jgi:hypothetical protein
VRQVSGQSMVEFSIALSSLSLLLLGTVTVAGYQEAQRRTVFAARHAAFDALWQGGRTPSQPDQKGLFADHFDDAGLTDATGATRLVDSSGLSVHSSNDDVPGQAAIATRFLLTPLRVASGFLGISFDLSAQGYERVRVETRIAPQRQLPEPFASLELTLSQSAALVGDGWNAADSAQVRTRSAGLVPTQQLSGLSAIWRVLATPLSVFEPGLNELCLGLIEPEGVPADRLGTHDTAPRHRDRCK